MERTVIHGNEFYEIDLECEKKKKSKTGSQHSETTDKKEKKTSKDFFSR